MAITEYEHRLYQRYETSRGYAPTSLIYEHEQKRASHLTRFISQHFPADPDAAILDLGCGHGTLVSSLRQVGYKRLEGIDLSPEQITIAERLGITGVRQGNLINELAGMANSSRNVIITFDVIEHLPKAELITLAEEIYRVLAPDGSWLIHTVNGASPLAGRMRYGDLTHQLAFTTESLAQLLRTAGFERITFSEDRPAVHGLTSLTRWLLWVTLRVGICFAVAIESGVWDKRAILTQTMFAVGSK
jgi:2-polyprenyl-3-methyl-5-hydroxy-6-metoxy-1,4-benzoquinol methylase